ncbi:hypothetical protein LTR84_011062 [Exophiala bonariae]|uniref:NAD(P)-binding domain-containing protein n=1 Tax=Exophiala bonariae TaxID=1690606 RepID=A0AAV9NKN3_9EURO|nr:hypothetical protein LTR84_011062 [Exophiala bonariae]
MTTHILVLGATGPSGLDFVHAALREGHTLTLYLRNAAKLPTEVKGNALVTVIQGQLDDQASLEKAASCGSQSVVSFLGPVIGGGPKNAPSILQGYENLVPKLIAHDFKRGLFLSTPSYNSPEDSWAPGWYLIISLLWLTLNWAYRDVVGFSTYIASQPVDKLRWTLFRVPNLRSGPARPVVTTFKGKDRFNWNLERKALAEWVLLELKQDRWIGRAPVLYNA